MKRNVLQREIFLFVGKDRKRLKVLYWDGTGLCIFQKRLSQGRFVAPWKLPEAHSMTLTCNELNLLIEGCEHVGRLTLRTEPCLPQSRTLEFR